MKSTLATFAALLALGSGCTEEPQVPQGGAGPVGTGDLLGTPQPGQVWSMPDTGSSEGIGANRPKMSDAALGYYQQGMQAFVGGDLPNAKHLFQSATEADSKAFQAFYSLGVVQERLGDDGATCRATARPTRSSRTTSRRSWRGRCSRRARATAARQTRSSPRSARTRTTRCPD